jgi:fructose-bisphosphate aldolase class II
VATTKRVVERAHAKGLSVEAELGRLGGVEEDVQVDEGNAFLTDPKEAVEFVLETGCDSLAAAIGTSHCPYKFKGKQKSLHFEVIREIQKLLPGTPIVMHGSSSVPEEEVRRINEAGGKLDPSARGVDEEEYLPAARLEVTKINIDTDGRLVWTRVHREFFRDHPEQFDFRPPGKTLWRSTPSLSPTRARNLDQRASCHPFARRSPENFRVPVNSAHNENAYSRRS